MKDAFSTETQRRLASLLQRFRAGARPGALGYEWCHSQGGAHPFHLVFGAMVHGNEFGSLPAAVRLVEALNEGTLKPGVRVTVFLGNPEAARENRRYLEADLNRVFLDNPHQQHEHQRAREIMPILDAADAFIDFHQTILQTEQPFYISPWHKSGWHWARSMQSAGVWVTRDPASQFSAGTRCTDEYVCMRGKPGLTVELSEKGFHDSAEQLCWQSMLTAIQTAETVAMGQASLAEVAARAPDLSFFTTTHMEPFATPDHALRPGLVNFQAVAGGEQLSANKAPPIVVPNSGMLLFPKYPVRRSGRAVSPLPGEIYRLITPLPDHPMKLWESD
jgi:hypothetical protein